MPYITIFDDDPDTGPARFVTVESLHFTGPGARSLVGEISQRVHPLSVMRSVMAGESGRTLAEIKRADRQRNRKGTQGALRVPVDRCACGEPIDDYDQRRRYRTCRVCRGIVQARRA